MMSTEKEETQFKELLAIARNANYAHAGEEEAIDLLFNELPKVSDQIVLDVGSGLGGTADYVQSRGWGKTVGIDLNANTVAAATSKFPDIKFYHCDVLKVDTTLDIQPDIIYMFNVLYAISDHTEALAALSRLAKPSTWLALFIYTDLGDYKKTAPKAFQLFNPIKHNEIEQTLNDAGWELKKQIDLNNKYLAWYRAFVEAIKSKKEPIIAASTPEMYEYVLERYKQLIVPIEAGTLGGSIVYAKPR